MEDSGGSNQTTPSLESSRVSEGPVFRRSCSDVVRVKPARLNRSRNRTTDSFPSTQQRSAARRPTKETTWPRTNGYSRKTKSNLFRAGSDSDLSVPSIDTRQCNGRHVSFESHFGNENESTTLENERSSRRTRSTTRRRRSPETIRRVASPGPLENIPSQQSEFHKQSVRTPTTYPDPWASPSPHYCNHHSHLGESASQILTTDQAALLTQNVRHMQYEISFLKQKLREHFEEYNTYSLRYSKAVLVVSNLTLSFYLFYNHCLETREKYPLPRSVRTFLALPKIKDAGANSVQSTTSLVRVIGGFLSGLSGSATFAISTFLFFRRRAYWRNIGFVISTVQSLRFLLPWSRQLRGPAVLANYINLLINLFYVFIRYYYLHGLLAYSGMRML